MQPVRSKPPVDGELTRFTGWFEHFAGMSTPVIRIFRWVKSASVRKKEKSANLLRRKLSNRGKRCRNAFQPKGFNAVGWRTTVFIVFRSVIGYYGVGFRSKATGSQFQVVGFYFISCCTVTVWRRISCVSQRVLSDISTDLQPSKHPRSPPSIVWLAWSPFTF
jgi:hypothetical protein